MPELPDITLYIDGLRRRILGSRLTKAYVNNPFLLKTYEPPLAVVEGKQVAEVFRIGKRIVISTEQDYYLVFHLMVMGRFRWKDEAGPIQANPRSFQRKRYSRADLAIFVFSTGTLSFTESTTKHRASLHVVQGRESLQSFHRGGIEVFESDLEAFRETLYRENHMLKRCLTDPRLFSGIGNAYSDEILHRARLSPLKLTSRLEADEVSRLYEATRTTLGEWTARLSGEAKGEFPKKVTAFHDGMAVHGRYGKPCPTCGSPVQRIVYAENECNYCAACQTEGRVLADRALSRLLKNDWPRTLSELEEMKRTD